MATTNFPTSLDTTSSLPNPGSGDITTAPSHASQHDVENDALRAIEAKVGIGASTPTANKVLRATGTGTTAYAQVGLTTDVTGTLPVTNGGTGITTLGNGIATFLGTPSSANLAAAVTDETGTGVLVFNSSPTIITPTIASFTNAQHTHADSTGGGQLNGANAILDGTLTPSELVSGTGMSWSWQSWTPTWTGTTIGNATVVAKYSQVGKTVSFRISVTIGSTTVLAVAADTVFTLPVAAVTAGYTQFATILGTGGAFHSSTFQTATILYNTTVSGSTTALLTQNRVSGSLVITGAWDTANVSMSVGDIWAILGTYEAA